MGDLAAHAKEHPLRYQREVHNAPDWVFLPHTSLGVRPASKYLGIGYYRLLKNADLYGLTVLYRNRKGRSGRIDKYFLLSELKPLKEKLESVTMEDALRSAEDRHEYFEKTRRRKIKIRRAAKSHTG